MHHAQTFSELRLYALSLLYAEEELPMDQLRERKDDRETAARRALTGNLAPLDAARRVAPALAVVALDSVSRGNGRLRERLVRKAEENAGGLPKNVDLAEQLANLYDLTRRTEYHTRAREIARTLPAGRKAAEISGIFDNVKFIYPNPSCVKYW